MDTDPLSDVAMRSVSSFDAHITYEWNAIMKRNLVTSGLVGAFALALTTAATLPALAGNPGSSQQLSASAASSPLILVRGGGGGGHGGGGMGGGGHGGGGMGGGGHGFGGGHEGGGHGFHRGHFRSGFSGFDDSNCWWSPRYHQWLCY
jgi:hypothetical protein